VIRRLVFWTSAALIGYGYAGFPLLVWLRGRLVRRPAVGAEIRPVVSIVIAAHDEARTIEAKLDNLAALTYPRDRLEVVIASDGSTDETVARITARAAEGVRVLDLPRVGKADALNAAVAASRGEVLVFSDANSLYDPAAIEALVRPLADPAVGGVAGNQVYVDAAEAPGAGGGETAYWALDRRLKRAQAGAGSVISATGAIYAIRRELFRPIPPGVTDDFYTSASVVAQGRRLVFAADAVAYEPVASTGALEFGRKVRVMTRGLRGVLLLRELMDPRQHGFYAVQVFSHKLLRRLLVVPLLAMAASGVALWRAGPVYRLATAAQVGVAAAGIAGLALHDRPAGRSRLLAVPAYFLLVNAAALAALRNVLTGKRIDRWSPQREAAALPGDSSPAAER
jgi:GT2 family glycosyltransferase